MDRPGDRHWIRIGGGSCGGRATGGYFAEPGLKDVPDLDRIGFPIAEIRDNRSITITKPPGSGGRIDRHTILEQILYEMHDPAAYITPDATDLDLAETGKEALQGGVNDSLKPRYPRQVA